MVLHRLITLMFSATVLNNKIQVNFQLLQWFRKIWLSQLRDTITSNCITQVPLVMYFGTYRTLPRCSTAPQIWRAFQQWWSYSTQGTWTVQAWDTCRPNTQALRLSRIASNISSLFETLTTCILFPLLDKAARVLVASHTKFNLEALLRRSLARWSSRSWRRSGETMPSSFGPKKWRRKGNGGTLTNTLCPRNHLRWSFWKDTPSTRMSITVTRAEALQRSPAEHCKKLSMKNKQIVAFAPEQHPTDERTKTRSGVSSQSTSGSNKQISIKTTVPTVIHEWNIREEIS